LILATTIRISLPEQRHQKRPRAVKVRNVAGLSYTTSSAFIFSSRRRFWASNSAIAALVDTGSLVYLIAALWCRSKLALTAGSAGAPRRAYHLDVLALSEMRRHERHGQA